MAIAVAVGGFVGLEREFHGRAAGFRTHILLCLSCCIIMLVSTHFPRMYEGLNAESIVRLDPARVAYGVVTGVGFLGAGVIIKGSTTVHGLTTAATLWAVAALGLGTGVGMYYTVIVGALLTLLASGTMRQVGSWIPAHYYKTVTVTHSDMKTISALGRKVEEIGQVKVLHTSLKHDLTGKMIVGTFALRFVGERDVSEVYDLVSQAGDFNRIEIK